MPDISRAPEWQQLIAHADEIRDVHLRDMFGADPGRGRRMTVSAGDLLLDYSKQRLSGETLRLLVALAVRAGVAERRDAMFAGEHINVTEDRAVLHVALRMPGDVSLEVDGGDVVADVHRVLDHMGEVADRIRSGAWLGSTGRRIRTVVNIGIGGSDLGPAMAFEALKDFADAGITCRFVS
ncbi:MAG TPA: glucose-6-phosphate isomerase, partial [Acidimicrobiales bacterium]|nr:glucose-6-phosphate isomerase [Acidimicrobiales bacterium]